MVLIGISHHPHKSSLIFFCLSLGWMQTYNITLLSHFILNYRGPTQAGNRVSIRAQKGRFVHFCSYIIFFGGQKGSECIKLSGSWISVWNLPHLSDIRIVAVTSDPFQIYWIQQHQCHAAFGQMSRGENISRVWTSLSSFAFILHTTTSINFCIQVQHHQFF